MEILGLSDVPNAGEIFVVTENDKEARSFAETFISEGKEKLLEETKSKMSLDDLFTQIQAGNLKELGLIVKADVQGSVEAVKQSLLKLSNEEVVVKIIHSGVGAINESDVTLAATSNAIIIGFNVRPDATAKATAEREGVDIRLYRVIYDAIADVENGYEGYVRPHLRRKSHWTRRSAPDIQGFRCGNHCRFLRVGRCLPEKLQDPYFQRRNPDLRRILSFSEAF